MDNTSNAYIFILYVIKKISFQYTAINQFQLFYICEFYINNCEVIFIVFSSYLRLLRALWWNDVMWLCDKSRLTRQFLIHINTLPSDTFLKS